MMMFNQLIVLLSQGSSTNEDEDVALGLSEDLSSSG